MRVGRVSSRLSPHHTVPQLALHLDTDTALLLLGLDRLALQLGRDVGRTSTHHGGAHDDRRRGMRRDKDGDVADRGK